MENIVAFLKIYRTRGSGWKRPSPHQTKGKMSPWKTAEKSAKDMRGRADCSGWNEGWK